MASELPSSIVAEIQFIGRASGTVKTLSGFKKGQHTLPDAANAATTAFLAKICATELAEEAEDLFQRVRAGLGYKRRDVSLSVASPHATLQARDFTLDFLYALEDLKPAEYRVTKTLRELRNRELARTEEFTAIFAGMFAEISFALKKGASVEAVIDAIEALDGEGGLAVDFPSDYRECVIRVEGVDAQVRCTGMSLDVVFPRGGSPGELMEQFAAVRAAFGISRELAGMIG